MLSSGESNISDEQIVKAINKDDHEAFKILYYRYFPPLFRFGFYRLYSKQIVEDLVQEVFFNIWKKRVHLNPDKSIKAYLFKSLNNSIINHSRLASSRTASIEEKNIIRKIAEEKDIDSVIDVKKAVQKLPEKLKVVYILSRVEGYKYSEIAEICSISVKAVEKRMSKVFVILRKSLEA
jgi:RNA polymerase sigma-70 factor (ECF subfamily)